MKEQSFSELNQDELIDVNGGVGLGVAVGIVVVGVGGLALGVYNGYKDTQSSNKKK